VSFAYNKAGRRIKKEVFTRAPAKLQGCGTYSRIENSHRRAANGDGQCGNCGGNSCGVKNIFSTFYKYDKAGQIIKIKEKAGNKILSELKYEYDKNGNIIKKSVSHTLTPKPSPSTPRLRRTSTLKYTYDKLDRLIIAEYYNGGKEAFAYDKAGNRWADINGRYAYDAANRLTGIKGEPVAYGYDYSGNLVEISAGGRKTAVYGYDAENRLIKAEIFTHSTPWVRNNKVIAKPAGLNVSFAYDPFGRRIKKVVDSPSTPRLRRTSTLNYIYDNENIIAILNEKGNLITQFIHGPNIDEPIAMIRYSSIENNNQCGNEPCGVDSVCFYHADALGSINYITNDKGNIIENYEYTAYGKPTIKDKNGKEIEKSSIGNPFMFTAREYDFETGLYYYRARYYNPNMGRFLQEDPIGFSGGDLNLYAYVQNNPVNFRDPYGLLTIAAQKIVNELMAESENASTAWAKAYLQRDTNTANQNLALRDAEHYLYAKAYVETAKSKLTAWFMIGVILTPGYEIAKILNLFPNASPWGLQELIAGYEGAWSGLTSGEKYQWTNLWEENKRSRCK